MNSQSEVEYGRVEYRLDAFNHEAVKVYNILIISWSSHWWKRFSWIILTTSFKCALLWKVACDIYNQFAMRSYLTNHFKPSTTVFAASASTHVLSFPKCIIGWSCLKWRLCFSEYRGLSWNSESGMHEN